MFFWVESSFGSWSEFQALFRFREHNTRTEPMDNHQAKFVPKTLNLFRTYENKMIDQFPQFQRERAVCSYLCILRICFFFQMIPTNCAVLELCRLLLHCREGIRFWSFARIVWDFVKSQCKLRGVHCIHRQTDVTSQSDNQTCPQLGTETPTRGFARLDVALCWLMRASRLVFFWIIGALGDSFEAHLRCVCVCSMGQGIRLDILWPPLYLNLFISSRFLRKKAVFSNCSSS